MAKPVILFDNGDLTGLSGTAVGQVLIWNNGDQQWEAGTVPGSGTVTQIDTGTGLTGGPITGSGTISLAELSPDPAGSFTNATVTVDAYGRVTSASSGSITFDQEYFVALNGSDTTGDGSLSAPYATVAKAVEVANAVAGTSFLKISVAPGTYSGSFTISRPNILIEGAGSNPEERFTSIAGTVTIDSTAASSTFNQQVGLAALFIQSSTTSPAVRFTGTGAETLSIDGCLLYVTNAAANVIWCDSTAADRSITILRDTVVLHGSTAASASVAKFDYGDIRFDSMRLNTSGSGSTGYGVELLNSSTLFADRIQIDVTTTTAAIFGSGTSATQKVLLSNASITNRGNNANAHAISVTNGSLLSGNIAVYAWQVLLTTFNASAKAINGTTGQSGVYYGALSFGPNAAGVINSSIAFGVTLLPLTEKLGNLDAPLTSANGGTGLGAPIVGDAGKVLAATALGTYELVTNGNGTVTSITAGDGLSGGTITTSGTISMPNVGTAGGYGSASSVPVITTDAQGRVTGVVPTSIAIAQSAVTDLVSDLAGKVPTTRQVIAGTGLSGGGSLSSDVTLSLPSVGTQGTYGSASSVAVVTTDQQGRVSNAVTTSIAITQSQVADLVTDLGLKADKSVTISAGTGLTGGGDLSANRTLSLDTVGTAQTSLGSASKTVTISTDAYGRVTSLAEQAIGSLPASVITSGQIGLANGGTGIDASGVTAGQLLVGGSGVLALQSVSGDATLASSGAVTVTGLQTNPVASGALGAGDAGKALVWSGSTWEAAEIQQGGGGGGGLTLYLNYAASSPYVLDTAFDEHAQWDTGAVTVANDANGTELARFYTPTSFVVEVIPAGIWDLNVYAQASGAANDTAIRAKVGIWNGSTLTILGTSDYAYITDPSVLTQYKASVYVPTTDLTTGDRIAVVIEGRRFAATTQTVTNYFGVGAISHVHSTLNAPGGTGLLKVVDGYLQSPASLLLNADVDAAAAIAVSKLEASVDEGYVLTSLFGVPTWAAPALTGVYDITGTEDQVLVNGDYINPYGGNVTLSLPQSIGTGSSPSFTGLTVSGLTNGLVKASSGVLSGGNSVSLGSEVSGTLGVGNGGTGLSAAGASGNLLVSDGSAFASVAMSGDATIASTGALTLTNTGTAGTYGSSSAVPVFVTDAQGRVTSVTNTNIAFSANAVTSLTGTANQVLLSGGPQGAITLSLPQDIGTGSSPTFSQVTTTARVVTDALRARTSAGSGFSLLKIDPVAGDTNVIVQPTSATTPVAAYFAGGSLTAASGTAAAGYFTGGGGGSGTGNGGDAYLRGGGVAGSGLNGRVFIGDSSTRSVSIGAVGITTTILGQLGSVGSTTTVVGNATFASGAANFFGATSFLLPLTTAGYVKTNASGLVSSSATVSANDLTGTVAVTNGGTGTATTQANKVFAGPTTGADAAPSFRALVAADVAGLTPYDLSGEFVGTPVAGAVIMRFVAARAFTFGGTAYFACVTAPTSTATFTVNVNGVLKGTVDILTSATSGTGSITSTSAVAGDLITVVATTPAAIVSPYWTLPGTV